MIQQSQPGHLSRENFNSERYVYPSVNLLLCSVAESCLIVCNPMDCSNPGSFVFHCLAEFAQTHDHWVSPLMLTHVHCCYLTISSSATPFLFCLQSFPASGSFQWVSSSHQVARVLEFQLQHQSFNEYSRLISFRIDWFDILTGQGTLKESSPTPQFKSINCSALSLLYGSTLTSVPHYWKNHSFDYTDSLGKLMSLLFDMLSRLS